MFLNHFFECNFCKVENKIKIEEDDRGQIQMKKGEELPYTCVTCHKKDKIHVNKIYAKSNKKVIIIISIIISILTLIFSLKYGFIAYISLSFPLLVNTYLNNIENNFNSYRIKSNT